MSQKLLHSNKSKEDMRGFAISIEEGKKGSQNEPNLYTEGDETASKFARDKLKV